MVFSPDGKYLYVFAEDVLIYETTEFKHVDTWSSPVPIEDRVGDGMDHGLNRLGEPGAGILHRDFPCVDRCRTAVSMGIARVNLSQKSMDFFPLGPAMGVSFTLAPIASVADGLMNRNRPL